MTLPELADTIRSVPDFPEPGIVFRDITPLLQSPPAFAASVDALCERAAEYRPEGIVAVEARGFLFGAAMARELAIPLLLVRKPGKLPAQTTAVDYALEYGSGRLEIHSDSVRPGMRYAVVDDVLATGGTAAATAALVEKLGGTVVCQAFLMELPALNGRARLQPTPVEALLAFQ